MARGRVTSETVDRLRAADHDQYVWDFELPGFGVKVTPAGSRVYLVQYRLGGRRGRTRRITIGHHGTITAEVARETAVRIKETLHSGRDPAVEFGLGRVRAGAPRSLPSPATTLRRLREREAADYRSNDPHSPWRADGRPPPKRRSA